MFEIMYTTDGAGLAAPQVGIPIRLVVLDPAGFDFGSHVLINPTIISSSTEEEAGIEACLSIPGVTGRVFRPTSVSVKAYDLDGNERNYKSSGWVARLFQHEIDHLNGILFPDRMRDSDALETTASSARRRAAKAVKSSTT
jgi:peptide deformylase